MHKKVKRIFNNKRGSALIFVMMVLFVAVILGTSIVTVNSSENRESIRQDQSLQAYYLAKSGAEAMANTIINNSKSMSAGDFQNFLNTITGHKSAKTYVGADGGYFEVEIVTDADKGLGVVSTGTMRKQVETVTVWLTGGKQSLSSMINCAVFVNSSIKMTGSSGINGDTYTNIDNPSNFNIAWSPFFNGNLYVSGSSSLDWTDVKKHVTGNFNANSSKQTYTLPEFPIFPLLTNKGNFSTNDYQEFHIAANYYYPTITVTGSAVLYIDTNNQDCNIVCDKLSIEGAAKLLINGSGTVRIYIKNEVEILNSSSVGTADNLTDIMIYYAGSKKFSMNGDTRVWASFYAKQAELYLGGSDSIRGIIASGGSKVTVAGGFNGQSVFAPNAAVYISVNTKGPIIAKTLEASGDAKITYSNLVGTGFDTLFSSSSSSTYEIGSWE